MKKNIIVFSLAFIAANAIAVSSIFLANANLKAESAPYFYTLTLDKNNQIKKTQNDNDVDKSKNTDTGNVKSAIGTEIAITYTMECDISSSNHFIEMGNEDYFEFEVPVNGLTRMEYKIDQNMKIEAGYSKGDYILSDTVEVTDLNSRIFSFTDLAAAYGVPPCYVRFTSLVSKDSGKTLNIEHLKLYYTCEASPSPVEQIGTWSYEDNQDIESSITITGFHIESDKIPAHHGLYIPQSIDGKTVTRINEGVLNNVPWLERLAVPFVGECRFMDRDGFSYNFASIFGHNDAHNKYRPLQQYEGDKVNIWYIPRDLHAITVTQGSQDKDGSIYRYYLPSYSFYGCSSFIDEINLNGRFDEIGEFAFTNCSTLKEIILPATVESVGKGAFTGCNSLFIRSISNIVSVDDEANPGFRPVTYGYQGTIDDYEIIYDICTNAANETYLVAVDCMPGVKNLNVVSLISHDSGYYEVRKIANRAFENHTSISSIRISTLITSVGHYAFHNCYKASAYLNEDPAQLPQKYLSNWDDSLCAVYTDVPDYSDIDKVCFFKSADTFYLVDVKGNTDERITLDVVSYGKNFKTVFPHHAFDNDARIQKVIFPKNIVFKPYSFANCYNLEEIEYEGTMNEFDQLRERGDIGFNSFVNTSIFQVKCSDGWTSIG